MSLQPGQVYFTAEPFFKHPNGELWYPGKPEDQRLAANDTIAWLHCYGLAIIEVEEIIPSSSMGKLVVFRQHLVDPDKRRPPRRERKVRTAVGLKSYLKSRKFNLVDREAL